MDRSELVNLKEAADALGVNRSTVARRVAAGELPAFRSTIDRRSIFVPRREIEALRSREFSPLPLKEAVPAA